MDSIALGYVHHIQHNKNRISLIDNLRNKIKAAFEVARIDNTNNAFGPMNTGSLPKRMSVATFSSGEFADKL